ncbi:hypothetical protein [Leucobacter sp. Ag1]|uniref:hypothetical protein n=1 Tax=Leucobacter sp. Ag1 TaxID=1642040 RepID=UPI0012E04B5A|nr:hypothetical protein [Leucobacter sp. Ag1]
MTVESGQQDRLRPFVPNLEATDEARAWAAATLADLPTVVTFRDDLHVQVEQDAEGRFFRKAFAIACSPSETMRFNINMFSGAGPDDLARAHRVIARAKDGVFNADFWLPRDGGRWVNKLWWAFDPDKLHPGELRPCMVPGCLADFHEWRDDEFQDHHHLEPIVTDQYRVLGENWGDGWKANFIDEIDCEGPAGLKLLRDLVNDYAWMQAECDKLNAAAEVSDR